jgi:hypothetical protein
MGGLLSDDAQPIYQDLACALGGEDLPSEREQRLAYLLFYWSQGGVKEEVLSIAKAQVAVRRNTY